MPNDILVLAEIRDNELKKVTFEMLGVGKGIVEKLGGAVHGALLGSGVAGLADTMAHYGAQKVYLADDGALATYAPEAYAKVLADLITMAQPTVVLMGATARGKDLAPRVAAKLAIALASDCIGFEIQDGHLVITRPIYAGKAIAKVVAETTPQMATVRPNIFATPQADTSRKPELVKVPVQVGEVKAKVVDTLVAEGKKLDLTEALIIVSGGRGLKGPENFKMLEELSEVLGGALGASRAAVDAGWIEHGHQVGQTGKVVTPTVYIACGISGAIQHLAGMRTSKIIVAINKDPEAPIFKIADYSIVGDLFQVVPVLVEEFKKLKAQE